MKNIPSFAKLIIERLNSCGHKAYLVGGCVRDNILGKEPKDWDITTSAKPQEVQDIFKDSLVVKAVIPTGIDFGTVTIVAPQGDSYEVTTFRGDIYAPETGISHKPKCVEYVDDIIQDLSRRDFTMNAIAYDINKEEYIDPFNGIEDIKKKIIKCVGNPAERFKEDPLRILRAIRFSAQLNFIINNETDYYCYALANGLHEISAERNREELNKILLYNPKILYRASPMYILKELIPELHKLKSIEQNNPYHCHNVLTHSIEATRIIEPELHLRLAALFHDLGKACTKTTDENGIDHFYGHAEESYKIACRILGRLKYSNDIRDKVKPLIKHHDRRVELTDKSIKKALRDMGEETFFDWCLLRYADIAAQEPKYLKERAKKIFAIEDRAHMILASKDPFNLKDLAINGDDLIHLGFKPGPKIGQVLDILLNHVIEDPNLNEKEFLLNVSKSYLM